MANKKFIAAWFVIFLSIGILINSIDAKKKNKGKKSKHHHRERRFFFDPTCPDFCTQSQAAELGFCGGMFLHKYYFNPTTMVCTKYLDTGCSPGSTNLNQFSSLAECQTACGGCTV